MSRKSRRIAGMEPDVRRSFRLAGLDPLECRLESKVPSDVSVDPVPVDVSEIYRRADDAAARYEQRYYSRVERDTNFDYHEYLYYL